jgi:hypothetical protein
VTGATGLIGATGVAGATGVEGTSGVTGATGLIGAIGVAGATGVEGTNGVTGETGVAGANGVAGAEGVTGTNGATGVTGATGLTGVTGAKGEMGAKGSAGAEGPAGPGTNLPSGVVLRTSNIEGIGDASSTVATDGVVTPVPRAGEQTRIAASGGLFRLSNGRAYFHSTHEWNPPPGGARPRIDVIWIGEVEGEHDQESDPPGRFVAFKTTTTEGSQELKEVSRFTGIFVGGELTGEGVPNTGTLVESINPVAKTLQMSKAATATHAGATAEVKAFPTPRKISYEYNLGWEAAEPIPPIAIEGPGPHPPKGWVPIATILVPAGATKSSEFTITSVRKFVG